VYYHVEGYFNEAVTSVGLIFDVLKADLTLPTMLVGSSSMEAA
jgi:hypothetical protein